MTKARLDLTSLKKAHKSLERSLNPPPANDRERDGAIQRFEYTFELCWKFMRRYFHLIGRVDVSTGPRPLIREAHQENLIQDPVLWFSFLDARNHASHIYDEKEAEKVFAVAKRFPEESEKFIRELEKRLHVGEP